LGVARECGAQGCPRRPFVLRPGDVVHIPELGQEETSIASGSMHTFRRKGVPATLKLRLLEFDEPLASLPYVLEYDGEEVTGTTDADGGLEIFVPPDTKRAMLTVEPGEDDERVYDVTPRALNPVEDVDGMQARLANLGYEPSLDGDLDEQTVASLKEFQHDQALEETGEADEATLGALSKAYEATK